MQFEGSHGAFVGILHGAVLNSAQDTERTAPFAGPFFRGSAVAEAVYRGLLIEKAHMRSRANPWGIWGGKSGSETGLSPSVSISPCQLYSADTQKSSVHLSPMLRGLEL